MTRDKRSRSRHKPPSQPSRPSTPPISFFLRPQPPPCTASLGPVRQDVYACTLCTPATAPPAGFCSACKYSCHATHLSSVFDLYSKRSFRCDCACVPGAPGAPGSAKRQNARNLYGHNFRGRYCRCDRGYEARLGEMTQCAVCEDWFHAACVNVHGLPRRGARKALRGGAYEMTCAACFANVPLLASYVSSLARWGKGKGAAAAAAGGACSKPGGRVDVEGCDVMWEVGFRGRMCACRVCVGVLEKASAAFLVDPADWAGGDEGGDDDKADAVLDGTGDRQVVIDVAALEDENEEGRKRAKVGSGAGQAEIQVRIRDFLEKNIESGGKEMSHTALGNYLADVKAEVIAGLKD